MDAAYLNRFGIFNFDLLGYCKGSAGVSPNANYLNTINKTTNLPHISDPTIQLVQRH
jgi:hypothetical protein